MNNFDAKYYTNSGIGKTNEGNFDEAINDFNKSLELNPNWALTYFSKAIVFHKINCLEEAYENYSKAIALNEKMTDAYYNRAQVVLAFDNKTRENLEKALSDLEKAIKLDKKFIDALYYAAVVEMKLGNYNKAICYLDMVIETEPQAIQSKALKKLILKKYIK